MTDQDFITDMLSTEKYITVSYSIAEHEASHEAIIKRFTKQTTKLHKCNVRYMRRCLEKDFTA